jgi:hypothetical protein
MEETGTLLLLAGALGALFGAVFSGDETASDRFLGLLLLAPSLSFATIVYLLGYVGFSDALSVLIVGQGALIATLIGVSSLRARR